MAEAVRRFREAGGSDVVRRMLARPIRLDPPRPRTRVTIDVPPVADRVQDAPAASAFEAPFETHDAFDDLADADAEREAETDAVVERLRAEMTLVKAILVAERAESASLRARIEQEADALGPEARATRDRWAGMVDRLLLDRR